MSTDVANKLGTSKDSSNSNQTTLAGLLMLQLTKSSQLACRFSVSHYIVLKVGIGKHVVLPFTACACQSGGPPIYNVCIYIRLEQKAIDARDVAEKTIQCLKTLTMFMKTLQ